MIGLLPPSHMRHLGLTLLAAASTAAARNPAAIEHHLRFGVRLAGRPDTSLDLLDRMRAYHVPGLSIAIIDSNRIVFAKGYGVKEFGSKAAVDTRRSFWPAPSASRSSRAPSCDSSRLASSRSTRTSMCI